MRSFDEENLVCLCKAEKANNRLTFIYLVAFSLFTSQPRSVFDSFFVVVVVVVVVAVVVVVVVVGLKPIFQHFILVLFSPHSGDPTPLLPEEGPDNRGAGAVGCRGNGPGQARSSCGCTEQVTWRRPSLTCRSSRPNWQNWPRSTARKSRNLPRTSQNRLTVPSRPSLSLKQIVHNPVSCRQHKTRPLRRLT